MTDLTLVAPTGKLTILVGPSGCGKTTSLRMVNRLISPDSGEILLHDQPTSELNSVQLRRRIGYVIQHAGLFPHRTIVDNIATTQRLIGVSKRAARAKSLELMERVGLSLTFADRYPWQLSGGQQQRVGVARALGADPEFMLMDEPFSAVDPIVRAQLQDEFLRIQRDEGKTIIMVTHDIDEALKLGDYLAVMQTGGRIVQFAPPHTLLTEPANQFVADFVGQDRGYRSLGFAAAPDLDLRAEHCAHIGDRTSDLRAAASDDWLPVIDEQQLPLGWIELSRCGDTVTHADLNLAGAAVPRSATLRELLDATLSAPSRRGIVVDEHGQMLGSVTAEAVIRKLPELHGK